MLTHYPLNTTGCIALSSSVPGGTLIGHLPFTKRPHFPPQFLAIKIHDHSNGAHSFTRMYQFPRNWGAQQSRPEARWLPQAHSLSITRIAIRVLLLSPFVESFSRPPSPLSARSDVPSSNRDTGSHYRIQTLTDCQSDFYTCNPAT